MGSGHGVISVSSHTTPEQPHRVGTIPHDYLLSELVGKMKEFPSEEPKKMPQGRLPRCRDPVFTVGLGTQELGQSLILFETQLPPLPTGGESSHLPQEAEKTLSRGRMGRRS